MPQTKQQKEVIALVTLLVIAAVIWLAYFGRSGTISGVVSARGPYKSIDAVGYEGVFKNLQDTQNTEYKPSGRNIFVPGPPPAPVNPGPATPVKEAFKNVGPDPPPPPPPPVLSMKFFGVGTLPASGPRRAFLLDQDEVHIVVEGDTLQNHIRITHIGNDRIEYEDINTGQKNSNPLEMPPPA